MKRKKERKTTTEKVKKKLNRTKTVIKRENRNRYNSNR
jgi:hypothetical protein